MNYLVYSALAETFQAFWSSTTYFRGMQMKSLGNGVPPNQFTSLQREMLVAMTLILEEIRKVV